MNDIVKYQLQKDSIDLSKWAKMKRRPRINENHFNTTLKHSTYTLEQINAQDDQMNGKIRFNHRSTYFICFV